MRLKRSHDEQRTQPLPLTSLIDVVFLLLIFFMVTSTLAPSESQLPSALRAETRSSGNASDFQPQVVNVEAGVGGPRYRVGEQTMTSADDLLVLLSQLPTDAGVFVRVSGQVPVSAAAAALQACRDAGFRKVSYVPVE